MDLERPLKNVILSETEFPLIEGTGRVLSVLDVERRLKNVTFSATETLLTEVSDSTPGEYPPPGTVSRTDGKGWEEAV